MFEYFKDLNGVQTGFFYIAIFFTILFIVQSLFTFLNIGDSFELDSDYDGHVDIDFVYALGLPFNLFTIRGIIGFFLMFGWSGLFFSKAGLDFVWVFLLALLCGLIMMFIIGLIYFFTSKLSESGNVELKDAIGKQGEVYIPIPGNNGGTGKVSIILNNSLKELDAITYGSNLASGDVVKVIEILNDKIVVEKINN